MKQVKRVLQIANIDRSSGVAGLIMNLYRNTDRDKVQFDFIFWNPAEDNYIEEIEHLGGKIYQVPYFKKNYNGFRKRIQEVLQEGDYEIIHCHEFLVSLPVLLWAKQRHVLVRAAHSHNPSADGFIKNSLVRICRPLFRKWSTDLFACSKASGLFLFGAEADFNILKNGIDLKKLRYSEDEREKLREQYGLKDKFVIGNIGRLSYQKNHEFLIDIFYYLYLKHKEAVLLIIGEGELREKLEKKVRELGLKDSVSFLGIRSDIVQMLEIMDVFVFPSNYEGLPIAFIEAQTMGLPCITSDIVPGEAQIIQDARYINLNKPAEYWADNVLEYSGYKRKGQQEAAVASGYDITVSAMRLERFYLEGIY